MNVESRGRDQRPLLYLVFSRSDREIGQPF